MTQGGTTEMIRRVTCLLIAIVALLVATSSRCEAQQAFARSWGTSRPVYDWDRFYHYPYVYYPQNFWTDQYYRSSGSLYYRYPQEMRIPVYNKQWYNYYPTARLYHRGHHFNLDVF
jgi:hypothetical protein